MARLWASSNRLLLSCTVQDTNGGQEVHTTTRRYAMSCVADAWSVSSSTVPRSGLKINLKHKRGDDNCYVVYNPYDAPFHIG
jgi:hypothetical protein